jgi:hypothetical protein
MEIEEGSPALILHSSGYILGLKSIAAGISGESGDVSVVQHTLADADTGVRGSGKRQLITSKA